MLIPFAEAVRRVAPLIDGGLFDRLSHNDTLREKLTSRVGAEKARDFVVWLLNKGILSPLDGEESVIPLHVDANALPCFELKDKRTETLSHKVRCYARVSFDSVIVDADNLNALVGFLSPHPAFLLDWQLAYRWAGKVPPLGHDCALLQWEEPYPLPDAVEDRLQRIRPFTRDGMGHAGTPGYLSFPLPAGRAGRLKLYSWDAFRAFAVGQGWSVPSVWPDARGGMAAADNSANQKGRKPKQSEREECLSKWLEEQKQRCPTFDSGNILKTREQVWRELQERHPILFTEQDFSLPDCPPTVKKFFDKQKLCRFSLGRR